MEVKQYATKQAMSEKVRINQKYLEINKIGNVIYKNVWDAAEAVLRGKFSVKCLPQETKQVSNNYLTLHKEL